MVPKDFPTRPDVTEHTGSVWHSNTQASGIGCSAHRGQYCLRMVHQDTYLTLCPSPIPRDGLGDLFSLAWSPSLGTLYIGCQDTSLQWFDFRGLQSVVDSAPGSGTSTPNTRKPHRFFDSYPQHERRPADLFANNSASTSLNNIHFERTEVGQLNKLQVSATNVIDSAHYGYLYCMAILEGSNQLWIIKATSPLPQLVHTFTFQHGAVLAIAARGETIYAGCQDGYVKVLDVETRACVRTIIVDEGVDILSVSLLGSDLYTFSAGGRIQVGHYVIFAHLLTHPLDIASAGPRLSIVPLLGRDTMGSSSRPKSLNPHLNNGQAQTKISTFQLITGGNDDYIKIWDVVPPKTRDPSRHAITSKSTIGESLSSSWLIGHLITHLTIEYALSKFVAFQSEKVQIRLFLAHSAAQANQSSEAENPVLRVGASGLLS
ncbi:di- and tripeptidase DUG [Salix suchowensis]|nr:di- and tripeptidase DUG [Salix suchowensis]